MQGKLIVIEGLDGSGKATQAELLYNRLIEDELVCKKISFPDYDSPSSAPVKMYLAGELGGVDDVDAYTASSLFTIDRIVSYKSKWSTEFLSGTSFVSDRYTTSNIAHQLPKLPECEWEKYIKWLYDHEFNVLRLPRPDAVIYLDMDVMVSQSLISKRYATAGTRDIHESNLPYLQRCRTAALYAAEYCGWHVVRCDDGSSPYGQHEIAKMVYSEVRRNINASAQCEAAR